MNIEIIKQGYEILDSIGKNRTMDDLLTIYEQGMKSSVVCQVLAIKAINEIEISKKWLDKSNYSKNLLEVFNDIKISEPWKLTFKDWIIACYPHFSFINYISISGIIEKIPYNIAERLTDDALKELGRFKNRERIFKFFPLIAKIKDKVIRKYQIMQIADTLTTKEKPKPFKKISNKISLTKEEKKAGKETSLTLQNTRLQKDIRICLAELQKKDNYVKELENKLTDLKYSNTELLEENKTLIQELKRYQRR